MKPLRSTLAAHDLRRVAVEGRVDTATVKKRLRGEAVRGDAGARADDALVRLGYAVAENDGEPTI